MDCWQSVVLGIIEGLTEFLPISSTAHLILAGKLFNIPQTEFVKSFAVAIQLGAILAIVFLYRTAIFLNKEVAKRIAAAFLPTAIVGFFLYRIFRNYLTENLTLIAWALLLGGAFLIVFEHQRKKSGTESTAPAGIENISYKDCLLIGSCQAVAIVPGVSRAAATIIGGLSLGVRRKTIVEFSFLLAVPTMVAATGYDLLRNGFAFSADQLGVLVLGFVTSFLIAMIAVKFLLHYIQRNDFRWFGVYRIVAGLVLFLFVL